MRTLTGYLVGVLFALVLVNALAWSTGGPGESHNVLIFSGGFFLGCVGMYIAALIYGYRRVK